MNIQGGCGGCDLDRKAGVGGIGMHARHYIVGGRALLYWWIRGRSGGIEGDQMGWGVGGKTDYGGSRLPGLIND